ncbi:beta-glucosidase family protein [Ruminiclostridium papyrosolvens]|uniref:Glycoside hydrolase n=1 Tax=Ruminiclostridium papyrosolvens C7 TaxID=1330534 RepID=U4R3E4_9FIRM|nr:glycoside hydrolase family 3 C-terminal domain-containing protein [Ruminiclostridium papyrosolvens]EPR12146.1 glycoside hydrolase [Ruminiclostridium papyrosolvens C7]
MAVNTRIFHCDEFFRLSREEKKEFESIIKKELEENPVKHLDTEWGRFENLPEMTEEEIDKLAEDVLSEMTLEQKVYQMSCDNDARYAPLNPPRYNYIPYYAGEDLELNIPAVKFTDGPTGIVMSYNATAFPVSIARGSTWDTELEERVGNIIGIEGRSGGANFFAGVCINLLRHPAWGRAQETYGEDTVLLGKMGAALTKGVQKHMMACIKHYVANSMENARFKVSVEMDERTLREIYLPHFKECVDAGAAAIMSSYNRVRGEWCGHHDYLLNQILNGEWGFKGFVMSDFIWGVRDTVDAANGGQCMEMYATQYFGKRLVEAVRDGKVDKSKIDAAVKRILRQKIRFSFVGDKAQYSPEKMGSKEHAELAREVSEKSTILLKNEGILPLEKDKVKKITVVGRLAVEPNTGDLKGSSAVFPHYVITPLQGIINEAGSGIEVKYVDGRTPHQAQELSKNADAVVIVAGLTSLDEGEFITNGGDVGGDRKYLGLHPEDEDLIETVSKVNKNVIVVLQGGSTIIVEPWKNLAKAILIQWYPGMEGGTALANILFGKVNPSAKLPVTVPATPQQLPYYDMNATSIVYDYYHGYFLADKKKYPVSYPFGFGLSYTTYSYSNPKVSKKGDIISVSVDVSNTGKMAGDEVVQLYIGYRGSKVERHVKDLKGFTKIHLEPGEKKTGVIEINKDDLAYYCPESKQWAVEDIQYVAMIGASSACNDLLKADFDLK